MSDRMPDGMSKHLYIYRDMPERMSEFMSDRIPDIISEYVSDRI